MSDAMKPDGQRTRVSKKYKILSQTLCKSLSLEKQCLAMSEHIMAAAVHTEWSLPTRAVKNAVWVELTQNVFMP